LRLVPEVVNDVLTALDSDFGKAYADGGRPSIAPERLLRALLLQAFYTIRSERQLMEQLIALAARHRLPAIYPYELFAAAGGQMTYGPDLIDQSRRSASYVDRILNPHSPDHALSCGTDGANQI
jgi:hypothetical protein